MKTGVGLGLVTGLLASQPFSQTTTGLLWQHLVGQWPGTVPFLPLQCLVVLQAPMPFAGQTTRQSSR